MDRPADVFEHLSRYGLDELLDLDMGTAKFWRVADLSKAADEGVWERSLGPRCVLSEILKVDEHD
jgi:hypothetical protein